MYNSYIVAHLSSAAGKEFTLEGDAEDQVAFTAGYSVLMGDGSMSNDPDNFPITWDQVAAFRDADTLPDGLRRDLIAEANQTAKDFLQKVENNTPVVEMMAYFRKELAARAYLSNSAADWQKVLLQKELETYSGNAPTDAELTPFAVSIVSNADVISSIVMTCTGFRRTTVDQYTNATTITAALAIKALAEAKMELLMTEAEAYLAS